MAGDGSVLNVGGPFPDGDGIDDLTTVMPAIPDVPRATDPPLGSQVPHQLLFQRSSRLNEQAAIDGLVRYVHRLIPGKLVLQPSGNLLRRPVQHQFTRNDLPQLPVDGQKTALGPQGRLPSLVIGFIGSIERSPAMAGDLSADLSLRPAGGSWRSHAATNRRRFLGGCLLARP